MGDLNKKLEASAKTKGKKRKFESNTGDAETEKAKSLRVLDSITNKEPRLDMDAAVNKQIFKEDLERRTEKARVRGTSHILRTKVARASSLASPRARTGPWARE